MTNFNSHLPYGYRPLDMTGYQMNDCWTMGKPAWTVWEFSILLKWPLVSSSSRASVTFRDFGPSQQRTITDIRTTPNSTPNGWIHMENTGKFFRVGRTFCATPLRLREPPELPSQAPGNPLHDPLWSSPCYIRAHSLSTTLKGQVYPITRKGLSLLPPVVRRHQHLPLGRQPWSPCNVPHTFALSI